MCNCQTNAVILESLVLACSLKFLSTFRKPSNFRQVVFSAPDPRAFVLVLVFSVVLYKKIRVIFSVVLWVPKSIRSNFSIVLRENFTKTLVENNTNQLIIIKNKNFKETILKILNIQ